MMRAAAVYVSKATLPVPDSYCSHAVHVALWISCGEELQYASYHDSPTLETLNNLLSTENCGVVIAKSSLLEHIVGPLDDTYRIVDPPKFDLNRLKSLPHSYHLPLQQGPLAMALLLYLDHYPTTQLTLAPLVLSDILQLDMTAQETIHLWPPKNQAQALIVGGNNHNNSLFGILSQPIATCMGKRCLQAWLSRPLTNLHILEQRQDVVEYLKTDAVTRQAILDAAKVLSDVDALAVQVGVYREVEPDYDDDGNNNNSEISRRQPMIGSTRKALQSLYQLYLLAAQHLPLLVESFVIPNSNDNSTTTLPTVLDELQSTITELTLQLTPAAQLARAVLDLEAAPREFLVQASYSDVLHDVANELATLEIELQECHNQMNQEWAKLSGQNDQVRLEQEEFRLPNTNDSKLLQASLSNVAVTRLLKNGVYFTTKSLRQLVTKKGDLLAEYERHQKQVVKEAMQVAATYRPVLQKISGAVAQLDVLAALAHVAAYHNYVRPQLTDGEEDGLGIQLVAARHPCVELQEAIEYIPNDVSLVFGNCFLLVTGPNMGGKSTYIRALGAIVTLAQIGSFVPCSSAKINLCHSILARVGAGDLQERGISTFMAEMLESASILKRATKRSLIIIDELGRGTSTFDGFGLARAISQYIVRNIGCMVVFTTHFHELTALQDSDPVSNCHVTAKKGNQGLTFLYEVKPGPCLESFGIQVAEMANVPQVVIQDAKIKAKELENFGVSEGQDYNVDDHQDAEQAAAALEFVNRFRRLDVPNLDKDALLQALALK